MGKCIRWSKVDEQFLLDFYPKLGAYECSLKLNRTVESIRIKANRLNLSRDGISRYNKPIYRKIMNTVLYASKYYQNHIFIKNQKTVNTVKKLIHAGLVLEIKLGNIIMIIIVQI